MAKSVKKRKTVYKKPAKEKALNKTGSDTILSAKYFLPALVFVFAFLLYSNTLNHSYALDDDIVSRSNQLVQKGFRGIPGIFSKGSLYGFNGINEGSYRPVSLLSFALEVEIWGNNPKTHHFFNILWYAVACTVLFLLFKRMFKDYSIWLSVSIALLFAAHPVHTEAVANFKSRDEVLMLLFLSSALLNLIRFTDKQGFSSLILSMLFFFMALLSKEQAFSFIAVIPLFLFFFTGRSFRKITIFTLPFLGVAGLYMFMRVHILDALTIQEKISVLNNSLSAATILPDRFATIILILGKYLALLFYPHPLSWDYSFNQIPIVSFKNPMVVITLVIYLSLAVYAMFRLPKKDILSFCILFFLITMSMVSNIFFLIGATMGERFLLTPSIAFCIALCFILLKITKTNLSARHSPRMSVFYGIVLGLLLVYSMKTILRNGDWKNNLSLFESGVLSSPNSTRTHASLAFAYKEAAQASADAMERGSYLQKARREFKNSLEIMPGNSYASYNLGVMEYELGNITEAKNLYLQTVYYTPDNLNALNNLTAICVQREDYDEALKYYFMTLKVNPGDANVTGNIGAIYQRKKNFPKAIEFDEKALALDPVNINVYNNLIGIFNLLGDTAKVRIYSGLRKKYSGN